MQLIRTLLLLVSFLSKLYAANVSDKANDYDNASGSEISTYEIEPFYPRENGIVNNDLTCYMNSLFSCLYSIPMIQSRVYEMAQKDLPARMKYSSNAENDTLIVALARLFARMRHNFWVSISMENQMYLTLAKELGWSVGENECVFEFWETLLEHLPANAAEEFKSLFEVQTEISFVKEDGTMDSLIRSHNVLSIDIPNEDKDCDIMSLMTEQYLTKNGDDLVDGKVTQSSIVNTPDVLIFQLQRVNYDHEKQSMVFYGYEIYIDNVAVNGFIYVPMAFILFSAHESHYYAVTFDYESCRFYMHNDEIVEELKDPNILDKLQTDVVMVFYAKETSLRAKIEELRDAVKADKDIPPQLIAPFRKKPLGLRATHNYNLRKRAKLN